MSILSAIGTAAEADPFTPFKLQLTPNITSYSAGFPSYPSVFARDIITSGILSARPELLISGIEVGAYYQAQKSNTVNGAEEGKIAHEKPGASLPSREGKTDYNACDTTALFLIATEGLSRLSPHVFAQTINNIKPSLKKAVGYIVSHIDDDIFIERPPTGSSGYALKVTMWKDSVLPQPGKEEPIYPVIYPQAHFIAARGLLGKDAPGFSWAIFPSSAPFTVLLF